MNKDELVLAGRDILPYSILDRFALRGFQCYIYTIQEPCRSWVYHTNPEVTHAEYK